MQGIRSARVSSRVVIPPHHFYKKVPLYKYDNKNVIYIAYVGEYKNEPIYKYGKSTKLFEREFRAHRKNFEQFEMRHVHITDNKDVIEEMFEKELLIRNIHRTLVINDKKQTELFTTTEDYSLEYLIRLLKTMIKKNPSFEVAQCQATIQKLKHELAVLKAAK